MEPITAGILFVASAAATVASIYVGRKNRRTKGFSMLPAVFGALTVIAGLLFVFLLLGQTV